MVDISIVNGIINQLIIGGAPPSIIYKSTEIGPWWGPTLLHNSQKCRQAASQPAPSISELRSVTSK